MQSSLSESQLFLSEKKNGEQSIYLIFPMAMERLNEKAIAKMLYKHDVLFSYLYSCVHTLETHAL